MASGVPKTGGTPLSSCSSLQERSLVRQDCCRFLSPVSLKVLARKGIELLGIASEGVYLIAHDETVGPVALGAHALTGVINVDLFGNHVFLSADRGGDCFCKSLRGTQIRSDSERKPPGGDLRRYRCHAARFRSYGA